MVGRMTDSIASSAMAVLGRQQMSTTNLPTSFQLFNPTLLHPLVGACAIFQTRLLTFLSKYLTI